MTRTIVYSVAIASVAFVGMATAQQTVPEGWPDLSARLQRAGTSDNAADLRALRVDLLRASTKPAGKEADALVQYAIAYLASRMAFLPGVADKERDDLLADGVQRLEAVLKANTRDVEAHILLGALLGSQIARSPMKGITLGRRAGDELERAAEIAPDNPRVHLQQGISAFNTPAIFGGGTDKAERSLRRSIELFQREPVDRPWPNWGRLDAHAWRGQALLEKGDRAGARAEYDKALAIAPQSGWVRYSLLPALEKAEKR
jgi:tetratricopeptide (TPR) repeat protein